MFDPSKLHTVEKRFTRKPQDFSVKMLSNNRFRVSDKFFNDNHLSVNGLNLSFGENNSLVLSVQSEESSSFLKSKTGSTKKGKIFTHPLLSEELGKRGFTAEGKETVEIPTNLVHEADGVKYFIVGQNLESDSPVVDDTVVNEVETPATATVSVEEEDELL